MQYLGFMGLISPSSTNDAASRSSYTTAAEKIHKQSRIPVRRMCFFKKLGFNIGMFKISRVKILWA